MKDVDGVGLDEAIAALRADIVRSWHAAAGSEPQFPIDSITVTLTLVATKSADGKAGFKVPFIGAELGGSAGLQRETTQTVTVSFDSPVDLEGKPIRVSQGSDDRKS